MTTTFFQRPVRLSDVLAQDFGAMSKENVTLSGGVFVIGQVIAKLGAKYVPLAPAAADDSAKAAAVCIANVDASAADQTGLVVPRLGLFVAEGLVWPAAITDAQKATAIAALKLNYVLVQSPLN
jgi:hypothetical protein